MAMAKETLVASKTTSKPAKTSSSLHHPPYFQMISEAISSLKERTGSSRPAIAKYMEDQYKANLPTNFKKMLSVQLKKFATSGKLVKIKNSYKLSGPEKLVKKAGLNPKEKKIAKKVEMGVVEGEKKEKKESGVVEQSKGKKMKRLSQVSTPSALKKKAPKSIKSPKALAKKRKV